MELGFQISDEEMFRTFNNGWGFGIIVDKTEVDKACMNTLEQDSINPERIGKVTDNKAVGNCLQKQKDDFNEKFCFFSDKSV